MKHLAVIQLEFLKHAKSLWNEMTIDQQWAYLRDHPNSKRKLTARPSFKKTKQEIDPKEIYETVLRND